MRIVCEEDEIPDDLSLKSITCHKSGWVDFSPFVHLQRLTLSNIYLPSLTLAGLHLNSLCLERISSDLPLRIDCASLKKLHFYDEENIRGGIDSTIPISKIQIYSRSYKPSSFPRPSFTPLTSSPTILRRTNTLNLSMRGQRPAKERGVEKTIYYHLTHITHLSLFRTAVGPGMLDHCSSLQSLTFTECEIEEGVIEEILRMDLDDLMVHRCDLATGQWRTLLTHPTLRTLKIFQEITEWGEIILSPSLEHAFLSGSPDHIQKKIVEQEWKNIERRFTETQKFCSLIQLLAHLLL